MQFPLWGGNRTRIIAACVVFLLVISWIALRFGGIPPAAVFIAGLGWAAAVVLWQYGRANAAAQAGTLRQASTQLAEEIHQREAERKRVDLLHRLNQAMAELHEEEPLMTELLSSIVEATGALGCSFVPVDEWRQPLPPFTYGKLPEPVLQAWSLHLASGLLRERCGNCQALHPEAGGCPLHPQEVGSALRVYCLPLERAGGQAAALLGVLQLYFPPEILLSADQRAFLNRLLPGIAAAYENAHLRAQELSTLRQVQLLHTADTDFSTTLGELLDGVKTALHADCVLVQLRKTGEERFSNQFISRGEACPTEIPLDDLPARIADGVEVFSPPGSLPVWRALPLRMQGGLILGFLLVASAKPRIFHDRQLAVLQSVSAQVALLVESERLMRSLEYKVIVQERTRLAREIHDGLAQTLAFLKMQSAQMQVHLAQGDLERLAKLLKENHQALAEAYLDTRQSIDNLRLTPQEGLTAWIDRMLNDFALSVDARVERRFEEDAQERAAGISPEIQAQLIRIMQESLSNVRKHAHASMLRVSLRRWQMDLILEIMDDGVGFDAEDVPEVSRHGLRGMRERAELVGADFQVISQVNKGTTIRLTIPIPAEETV